MPGAGLIDGILRIGKECITWERPNGERVLLIWPAGLTEFDEVSASVRLRDRATSATVVVRDGQRVNLAG
jgi:hypothetical protein